MRPQQQSLVLSEDRGDGIRVLTLNRPERLNALTQELVDDLGRELRAADADQECRVVVLTGSGRGFCAGFDLQSDAASDLAEQVGDPVRERLQGQARWAALPQLIRSLRPIVIAAVNGPAAGGGLAVALAADLRVAAPTAKLVVANIKLGLSGGEMGIAYHLTRLVGPGRAGELMYTGRPLLADKVDVGRRQRRRR